MNLSSHDFHRESCISPGAFTKRKVLAASSKAILNGLRSAGAVFALLITLLQNVSAQTPCSGTITQAVQGSFTNGFTYQFTSSGNSVTIDVTLLDPQVGLVALVQTYNPNFAELQMTNTGGQSFTATYSNQTIGAPFNFAIKFAWAAGGLAVSNILNFTVGNCPSSMPAAPNPTCPAANVISMFSNVYTNVPVNTWLTPWSQATLTDIQIAGNDTKRYNNVNFLGIETVGPNLLNLTSMQHLHLNIYTPNMTTFRIKLVDFGANAVFGGGDDTEHEIVINTPPLNVWNSLVIPLSDFTGLTSRAHIAQMIFSGIPVGQGTLFVDNVFFSAGCAGNAPTAAAPTPTCPSANVVSMFSNAYTNVPVNTWLTPWSQATLTDIQIAGNATKKYENVNFLGIETVGPNLLNLTSMNNLHLDVWTPNMTTFRIKLVDFGPNAAFGGGDDSEHEIVFNNLPLATWNSLEIPLSNFTGLTSRAHIAQMIYSGVPVGQGTLFVDNVYFNSSDALVTGDAD